MILLEVEIFKDYHSLLAQVIIKHSMTISEYSRKENNMYIVCPTGIRKEGQQPGLPSYYSCCKTWKILNIMRAPPGPPDRIFSSLVQHLFVCFLKYTILSQRMQVNESHLSNNSTEKQSLSYPESFVILGFLFWDYQFPKMI